MLGAAVLVLYPLRKPIIDWTHVIITVRNTVRLTQIAVSHIIH